MAEFERDGLRQALHRVEKDRTGPDSASSGRPDSAGRSGTLDAASIVHFQRTAGNAAVLQLLASRAGTGIVRSAGQMVPRTAAYAFEHRRRQKAGAIDETTAAGGFPGSDPPARKPLRLPRLAGSQFVQRTVRSALTIQRDRPDDDADLMSVLLPGAETGEPEIPNELRSSVNTATMTDDRMRERYRRIESTLAQFTVSTPDSEALKLEQIHLREALMAHLIERSIEIDLSAFQNITVQVPGTELAPLPEGTMGPPALATIPVTVHAAYFINTPTAREHVEDERAAAGFNAIIGALREEGGESLLMGGTRTRNAGRAVEFGKATPDDVRRFIQEAIDNGTIRRYAISQGKLTAHTEPRPTAAQQLSDLSPDDLKKIIQDWVVSNGVGVDCSGFVQQTLVRSREVVRDELLALGVAEGALPTRFARGEQNAASFQNEPRVLRPDQLQVGDVWVLNRGRHIRIVVEVRQAEVHGRTVVEFVTAESKGDSLDSSAGPTRQTWRTARLANFTGTPQGGTFHRPR